MRKHRMYQVVTVMLATASCTISTCIWAEGGLSLSQTRVIFDAKARSAKVTLNNQSDRVYLVKSRVLLTPESTTPTTAAVPFMVTPPLFRLEKESRNTVLIARNDTSALPTDRESVFYLSFLAIPAVKKNDDTALFSEEAAGMMAPQVSLGIRTVIKLFYRPSGLSLPPAAAASKLTFAQRGMQLSVNNPTPYYVTLARLTVNGQSIPVRETGAMIAPFASRDYSTSGITQANTVTWSVITDFGGVSDEYRWSR
ncbi:TPA: molecular chaperone [Morganella morganii]|nr:molecular chaperone [Morganella morganii]HAT1528506.1 molecular chaperone [Morganella morganii]HDF2344539.1 molecular chaperone [Morganella morganii]